MSVTDAKERISVVSDTSNTVLFFLFVLLLLLFSFLFLFFFFKLRDVRFLN